MREQCLCRVKIVVLRGYVQLAALGKAAQPCGANLSIRAGPRRIVWAGRAHTPAQMASAAQIIVPGIFSNPRETMPRTTGANNH